MKKITILLSSVLTLLLITSNNTSYAFAIIQPVFAEQPNKNVFKGKLRKGNIFKGNVRILPNRNSGGRFNPISKYSISDEPSFIPKPNYGSNTDQGRFTYIRSGKDGLIGENGKVGIWIQDGQPAISNEQAIMTRPYRLGEDVGSGAPLKGGSGSVPSWRDSDYTWRVEEGEVLDKSSPKGVLLKFINGEWR
jgi:hypothetical protein